MRILRKFVQYSYIWQRESAARVEGFKVMQSCWFFRGDKIPFGGKEKFDCLLPYVQLQKVRSW